MKRPIVRAYILILLLIALPSCLIAAPRYASVLLGAKELSLSPKAMVENGTVYAPVEILKALGIDCACSERKVVLAIDGDATELAITKHQGVPMIDLEAAAKALDVDYSWDDQSATATLLAKLVSVELKDSILTARVTLPVAVSSDRLWSPTGDYGWRASFDLPGTKLATDSKSYAVSGSDVSKIRLGQFSDDTARIVLDLDKKMAYKVLSDGPSQEIRIAVGETKSAPTQSEPTPAPKVTPVPDKIRPVNITEVKAEPDGDSKVTLRISTSGKAAVKAYYVGSSQNLVVEVEKGVLVTPNENIPVDNSLLTNVRTVQQSDMAKIVCSVSRLVVFDTTIDASGITLKLGVPAGAGGKLSDKLIVIDAGHGGPAKGAVSNDVMEKNINLLMAEKVKSALEEAGARVIMTRESDCDLGLAARPKMADDCHADFFISLHCNSNTVPESASGIETYYHFDQLSSKALACAIHDRVIQQTGMKDQRARSDGTLYDSGLAVLRNANVPAILIECGYINNSHDRGLLCDDAYRAKIAEAIVEGLRDYVEGKANQEGNS